MKIITFITNSPGKVEEAQSILGKDFKVGCKKIDLEEIQTINGKEVIEKKAKQAYKILKKTVLVEDTSLYFDAWNGLPGALVRWFLDTVGCEGICKMLGNERNRKAWAESAIAYFNGKKMKIVSARLEGSIPNKPNGQYKFGWDPIFIPKGYKKTFGEMGPEEKNKISMRKLALEKLRKYLLKD
mgnify:CR=1 FL=1